MSLLLTRRRWLSNQPPTRGDRPPYTLCYAIPVRRRAGVGWSRHGCPAPAVAAGWRCAQGKGGFGRSNAAARVGVNRVLVTGGGCAIYQGIRGITAFPDVGMALDSLAD